MQRPRDTLIQVDPAYAARRHRSRSSPRPAYGYNWLVAGSARPGQAVMLSGHPTKEEALAQAEYLDWRSEIEGYDIIWICPRLEFGPVPWANRHPGGRGRKVGANPARCYQLWAYLREYQKKVGRGPTYSTVCAKFRWARSAVQRLFAELERQGLAQRPDTKKEQWVALGECDPPE